MTRRFAHRFERVITHRCLSPFLSSLLFVILSLSLSLSISLSLSLSPSLPPLSLSLCLSFFILELSKSRRRWVRPGKWVYYAVGWEWGFICGMRYGLALLIFRKFTGGLSYREKKDWRMSFEQLIELLKFVIYLHYFRQIKCICQM